MLWKLRLPLVGKIFAVCFVLAATVSLTGSMIVYRGACHSLREEVRTRLRSTASAAALLVDPRLHESIHTKDDESSPAYRLTKAALIRIRSSNPGIRYIYTMRKTDRPNTWQFVVDAEEDPQEMSHVGDEYDISPYPEMQKALDKPTADKEPCDDEWGTRLSGYAPIRDASGRTVAILGMDMSAEQLHLEESALRQAMVHNTIVSVLVCLLVGMVFTRTLLRPIIALNVAAKRVNEGDLSFQIGMHGSDELGELTKSFDEMIVSLTQQSNRDFLTGVHNFTYFRDTLQMELDRAAGRQQELCLLVFDLDRFTDVNDEFGHSIGNSVLNQLGVLLKDNLRSGDIASRYGGDEFVVILPNTSEEAGSEIAERIRTQVQDHPFSAAEMEYILSRDFIPSDQQVVHLTCTVGLACYPKHHKLRDGLVMAADIALCRAKSISRNSVYVYDESVNAHSHIDPRDLYEVLHDASSTAIRSLAAAVDAKDQYTCGHSERVASYAMLIAREMGLPNDRIDTMRVAGLLHDLGKIGVPDSILNKAGSLTDEEREAIQRHPTVGGDIARRSPHLDQVLPGILFHHERYDGQGYPDGLAGDDIPFIARILAVADSFDAMTSDRPYRKAMSVETAFHELALHSGRQFDPDVVEAFVDAMRRQDRRAA